MEITGSDSVRLEQAILRHLGNDAGGCHGKLESAVQIGQKRQDQENEQSYPNSRRRKADGSPSRNLIPRRHLTCLRLRRGRALFAFHDETSGGCIEQQALKYQQNRNRRHIDDVPFHPTESHGHQQ